MEPIDRLKLLSSNMDIEQDGEYHCKLTGSSDDEPIVSRATLSNGRQISLVKTLLTSACERNCFYCPFRAGRDFKRATFKPEELASIFMKIYHTGIAQGLFLSSGIAGGGVNIQDKLIDTADILRNKYKFRGYIHLKIMPGAEKAQVELGMLLANRISVNLEAPNIERLQELAPNKQFIHELIQPLEWVNDIRSNQSGYHAWNRRWPSSVTQFVVGAAGESDLELLETTQKLYKQLQLSRVYYSSFRPIRDTPLADKEPVLKQRQHRLYQASFLLRDYGFTIDDIPLDANANIPLGTDPKLYWAKIHLIDNPIEINQADKKELLRIPGIGPKSVKEIIKIRRRGTIHDICVLGKVGINTSRVAPFILMNGKRPDIQSSFW